jgi:bacterial/archaeal transporter family-2 protein
MQSRLIFMILAMILGAILPIQANVNARLAKVLDSPVMAAFVSFAVGTVALLIYLFITNQFNFQGVNVSRPPWWLWIGGLLGVFFVAGIVVLVPRLGMALAFSLVIAGQMAAAIILDHFGLLGSAVREISPGRIAGALLLIAGVVLIRKY